MGAGTIRRMRRTIGYHLVKTAYGLWLPGDERGYWSSAWDEQIGYIEPHTLHDGDPVRKRMAAERMKHPPVRCDSEVICMIEATLRKLVERSNGGLRIQAIAIEPTHMHLLLPYTGRDIHNTAKWIADQTTKDIHALTDHTGPVWAKGKWCSFIYDREHWNSAERYIDAHNIRAGKPAKPEMFPIDGVESRDHRSRNEPRRM